MALGVKAIVSISLAVALVGGGGYAAYSFMNQDTDLATLVPANTITFTGIDLSPNAMQGAEALQFNNKMEKLINDKDGKTFHITDGSFKELDYETQVKPWLGDQSGTFISKDMFNEKLDKNSSYLDVTSKATASPGDILRANPVKGISFYEVKNKAKAQVAADAMNRKDAGFYVIDGDFMFVTNTSEDFDKYKEDLALGKLSESASYKADKQYLSENVGYAWMNIGVLSEAITDKYKKDIPKDFPVIEGRSITELKFENNGITIESELIEFSLDGVKQSEVNGKSKGMEALENLSGESFAAIGISDPSKSLKHGIKENQKEFDKMKDEIAEVEKVLGVKIPDGVDKILGSNIAVGMSGEFPLFLIAGADDKSVKKAIKNFGGDDSLVTTKDGLTLINTSGEKTKAEGVIKDHPLYSSALPDVAKSDVAVWFNASKLPESITRGNKKISKIGVMGFTSSFNGADNVTSMKFRWVL